MNNFYPNNVILTNIQAELKAPKGQYNRFGKYKYRSCEDILEALKPILHKFNAHVTLSDTVELIGQRFYIKATATIWANGEAIATTTAYAREEEAKKGMDASQITGTASSYARKYALNGLFLIDDTKDADTNEHRNQTQQQPQQQPEQQQEQQPETQQGNTEQQPKQQAEQPEQPQQQIQLPPHLTIPQYPNPITPENFNQALQMAIEAMLPTQNRAEVTIMYNATPADIRNYPDFLTLLKEKSKAYPKQETEQPKTEQK